MSDSKELLPDIALRYRPDAMVRRTKARFSRASASFSSTCPASLLCRTLSDVYAMGGEPKLALNLLCIPESMPKEAVHQLLRGGYDKVYEAGAIITGGHSILDPEPKHYQH